MPKNPSNNLPKYRCNKTTGRASVCLGGKVHWLGKHGTRESKEKYHRIVSEYLATGTVAPKDGKVIVADLILAYWNHCERYYRKPDGEPTNEAATIKGMLSVVRKLYGHVAAERFGPVALAGCREAMIRRGWTRKSINRQVCRVRAMFKWCASVEMIPATVHGALQTLPPLKAGRCPAKESPPVTCVPDEHIDAIEHHVSRQVWGLVRLQLLTGARPGELLRLRPLDLDTSDPKAWAYRPSDHKNAHRGQGRTIHFGPKAQEVLAEFLADRPVGAFLFSPREAEQDRRAILTAKRVTPQSCGNTVGSNRAKRPKREPGETYTTVTYGRAIRRGCDRAGIPRWSPNRLRHNAATRFRAEFGMEAARAVLGHATGSKATEIYAEQDAKQAASIAARVG